jgi:hypothetical protein
MLDPRFVRFEVEQAEELVAEDYEACGKQEVAMMIKFSVSTP